MAVLMSQAQAPSLDLCRVSVVKIRCQRKGLTGKYVMLSSHCSMFQYIGENSLAWPQEQLQHPGPQNPPTGISVECFVRKYPNDPLKRALCPGSNIKVRFLVFKYKL